MRNQLLGKLNTMKDFGEIYATRLSGEEKHREHVKATLLTLDLRYKIKDQAIR